MNWHIIISGLKQLWPYIFKIFSWVGFIVGLLFVLERLILAIPTLKRSWVSILKWFAEQTDFKESKKYAIKADIENVVNSLTLEIRKELPKEWARKANIEWVKDSKDFQFNDNQVILRMRPIKNQDDNLLIATQYFFKSIIFPKTKAIIPSPIVESTAFKITHRVIDSEKPFLIERFEKETLESAIKIDGSIATYFGKFSHLDRHGFFTSFLIRQIDEMAEKARLNENRSKIGDEINSVIEHALFFLEELDKKGEGHLANSSWYRNGHVSYAFLLVAREENRNISNYVNKAKLRRDEGIKRLYVIGRSGRIPFTKKVIEQISKTPGFILLDRSKLSYDYRGMGGGVGAVFELSK